MADDSLDVLLDAATRRFFGKYRGKVTDNDDPNKLGRLKVMVPAVLGEAEIWAMPCAPYAGDSVGFYAMPDAGTLVWVEFEGGHASYPIVGGCFWADGQIDSADASPSVKFFRTRSLKIRIDDDADELVIETSGGSKLTVSGSEIVLKAQTVSQTTDATRTDLTSSQFDVNNGAFTVA